MKLFDKIIGYDNVKNELYQIIDMFKNKELYEKIGAKLPRGVLIYGDPGLGKTMLAEAFIEECGVETFVVKNMMFNRELLKAINDAFVSASKLDKAIIFLDDMDKFSEDDEYNLDDRIFVTIQANIDSVKDKDILVIATANNISKLPESLKRNGRFDKKIQVTAPTSSDARKIIEYYLKSKKVCDNLNMEDVTRMIEYVSCADLESIINESAILATYARKDSIDINDIINARIGDKYHEAKEELECSEQELMETALHEAGHIVVAEAIKESSVGFAYIRVSENNDVSGFTYLCEEIKRRPHNIMLALGGKVACELFHSGRCASGCQTDLLKAINIFKGGIYNNATYGMSFLDTSGKMTKELSDAQLSRSEAVIQAELERYQYKVRELLISNKEFLLRITNELKEKRHLLYSDIQRIKKDFKIVGINE